MSEKIDLLLQNISYQNHDENFVDSIIQKSYSIKRENGAQNIWQLVFFYPKSRYFIAAFSLMLFLAGLNSDNTLTNSDISNIEAIYYSNSDIL